METPIVVALEVLVVLALIGFFGYGIVLYNSLVQVRVDVDTAWSNIDLLLKRRHDELGKLLDALRAYMTYEGNLVARVTHLRAQTGVGGDGPERMQAENALGAGIGRLLAVAESYPQLRAQDGFHDVATAISGIETQIARRREFYNAEVNTNNTRRAQFPDGLLADLAGVRERTLFITGDADKTDVDVREALGYASAS